MAKEEKPIPVRRGERIIHVVRESDYHSSDDQAEAVRLTTVQTLAFVAVCTGVLLALTAPSAGASFRFWAEVPGWPWLAGAILVFYGGLQFLGIVLNRVWWGFWGCLLCSTWYALFSLGFGIQWAWWVFEHQDGEEPGVYPVAVYFGLSGIHLVQAIAIYQKERQKKFKVLLMSATEQEEEEA